MKKSSQYGKAVQPLGSKPAAPRSRSSRKFHAVGAGTTAPEVLMPALSPEIVQPSTISLDSVATPASQSDSNVNPLIQENKTMTVSLAPKQPKYSGVLVYQIKGHWGTVRVARSLFKDTANPPASLELSDDVFVEPRDTKPSIARTTVPAEILAAREALKKFNAERKAAREAAKAAKANA